MKIMKERTLIKAYNDNDVVVGAWDILSNNFYGVKGQLLKGKSAPFMRVLNFMENESVLAQAINHIFNTIANQYMTNAEYVHYAPQFESIISVGLIPTINNQTMAMLKNNPPKLTKKLVDFIKTNYNNNFSWDAVDCFKVSEYFQNEMSHLSSADIQWGLNTARMVKGSVPMDWAKNMIIHAIHEKIPASYNYYEFSSILTNWHEKIKLLNEKLEAPRNILTQYYILIWREQEYKNTHYNDILKSKNDCDWLYFENESFIITPILTKEDFHAEAEYQHNCVERMYMERVYEGRTHVVAVRRKSNPNTPYITCEVSNKREIWQFLTRYNNRVEASDALKLKREYQAHLSASLYKDGD